MSQGYRPGFDPAQAQQQEYRPQRRRSAQAARPMQPAVEGYDQRMNSDNAHQPMEPVAHAYRQQPEMRSQHRMPDGATMPCGEPQHGMRSQPRQPEQPPFRQDPAPQWEPSTGDFQPRQPEQPPFSREPEARQEPPTRDFPPQRPPVPQVSPGTVVNVINTNTVTVSGGESYFDGKLSQQIGYGILGFLITILTLGICYPWALCMQYRWRIKHTVIGGRRLAFDGKAVQLVGKWLLWLLLCVITLGIYIFWVGIALEKWRVKHTHFAD